MSIDKAAVSHIAKLAHIELNDTELTKFSTQLTDILNYIDKLKELDVKEVAPLVHAGELHNISRDDKPAPSISKESAIKNAPDKDENFFKVYKVIE
ncbi:MAG: asparaginyl/glutamyl-tRNA amidotransferase subunit C [Planctomycetes bacterium RBG_16_43_13]|nr:MAG: asparaginyl/glutamyl-tRNA amidotransferase subunit C [Planctomycetes bacterium RBG_16_43_13]